MKFSPTALLLTLAFHHAPPATAQECINNSWVIEFDGACNYETVLQAYEHQVYSGVTGAAACASTAKADLDSKLASTGVTIEGLCQEIYDSAEIVPFTDAASKAVDPNDLSFEQHFFNGRTEWQEEVETIYETSDLTATSILKEDAEAVRHFYEGIAQGNRVAWPGSLSNFQSSVVDNNGGATCTTNAAMCCWTKDRQANDNNGNCAKPYDKNCVDKDPADNTDLCYVDASRGNSSNEFGSDEGLYLFPGDNNNGEGAIHCHGLAWSNDVNDASVRYKGNNLFYISMYDHMYQRGYVRNVPGAPMCGCVEQMPTVSRSDCTEIDLTETFKFTYDATTGAFDAKMTNIDINFNACKGINNRNNDLWAYIARLYYQGDITNTQFGKAGRIITDNGCDEATQFALSQQGMTTGYVHDEGTWTFIAGRDDLKLHDGYGNKAFSRSIDTASSSAPQGIAYRICANCVSTHKKIFYRRLTAIPDSFDLLDNLLWRSNDGGGNNVWGVDFTMHSTYEDALSGLNPWECPNDAYNYGDGFPGNCSPDGTQVKNQQSRFNSGNDQKDVAWYVNKPEASPHLQLAPSTTIQGRQYGGGSAVLAEDGAIYLTGSGEDIWGWNDDFNYYSEPFEGDHTVIVHVSSQSAPWFHEWSKAGIMVRGSMDSNSPHASVFLTGSRGICTMMRSGAFNGNPDDKRSESLGCVMEGAQSAWLKLEKRMDTYTSFVGEDDGSGTISWTKLHSFDVPLIGDDYNVGLAACSIRWIPMEVVFEDYQVQSYFFPSAAPSVSSAPSAYVDSMDIGNVGIVGSTSKSSAGIFVVKGSGNDIWGQWDQFQFYYDSIPARGDVSVEMFIQDFSTDDWYGKGGLMFRDSLAGNSQHYSLFMMKDGNVMANQWRECTNCGSSSNKSPTIKDRSGWIKITKTGNVFEAFFKRVGTTEWIKHGSTKTIDFSNPDYFYVGIAVTAHDRTKTAELKARDFHIEGDRYFFPSASPSVSSAPSAYVDSIDIGNVGIAGSASEFGTGDLVIKGSGNDIWGSNDQFHFYKHAASGNVTIEMFVQDFSVDYVWGKAGLMIRDSEATNSMHYSLFMTQDGNKLANQWRACTNCGSGSNNSPSVYDRSVWLKITKEGNVFRGYFKRVGINEWIQLGATKSINFSTDLFYVGIAVTSHDRTKTGVLRGSDFLVY